jgi:drug/metabolite transporter superfamily protein YnfA
MRRRVKTTGNILESMCVRVYTMVGKKKFKYVEANYGGIYT